jgi:hypothetical protein
VPSAPAAPTSTVNGWLGVTEIVPVTVPPSPPAAPVVNVPPPPLPPDPPLAVTVIVMTPAGGVNVWAAPVDAYVHVTVVPTARQPVGSGSAWAGAEEAIGTTPISAAAMPDAARFRIFERRRRARTVRSGELGWRCWLPCGRTCMAVPRSDVQRRRRATRGRDPPGLC